MNQFIIVYDIDKRALKADSTPEDYYKRMSERIKSAMKWGGFSQWKYKMTFCTQMTEQTLEEIETSVLDSIQRYAPEFPQYAKFIHIYKIDGAIDVIRKYGARSQRSAESEDLQNANEGINLGSGATTNIPIQNLGVSSFT